MKNKRTWAAAVAAALLLCPLGQATAEEEAGLPAVPAVTVAGVRVGGEEGHFELGLTVSAAQFQTVGVVLSYDDTVLIPTDWAGEAVPVAGAGWDSPAVLPTVGARGLAGKPALAYRGVDGAGESTGRSYLYLGADTLAYTALDGERVVTARFRYAEGKGPQDVTMPTAEAAPALRYTVELAPAAVAENAIPGAPLTATTGAGAVHRYAAGVYQPAFTLADGPGVDSGGGGAGDYAVTFFDWDGRVIDAIAAGADARDAVAAWQAGPVAQAALTGKPGYAFDAWLAAEQGEDGLVTGAPTSGKDGLTPGDPAAADFSDLSAAVREGSCSVLVQASYQATAAVNGGHGPDAPFNEDYARYQFGDAAFYQYDVSADANNGQYAVRCGVDRGDVLRCADPVVMAKVYIGEGANMQFVAVRADLSNTDQTSFEVVVPKTTSKVTYQVLDAGAPSAASSWVLGTRRSLETAVTGAEIIREGAFALLVDEALAAGNGGAWTLAVNAQCFRDAGYSKVTEANLDGARTALANASSGRDVPLDRAGADAALAGYRGVAA